jgi:hypothetical protein
MMYESKMAAAIKVKGKVLREFKDTVYIPFASEYSILLKNLNTTRAVVNVFIDGEDQVPGGIVLNAGQEVDLERSVKNGNLTEGNKFKFIERTGAVEQHRGVKLEDGIVRVEYQFEKPYVPPQWSNSSWISASGSNSTYNVNGIMRSVDFSQGENMKATAASATSATLQSMNINASASTHDGAATMDWMPVNDVGITVPGSKSEQRFVTTHVGTLESTKHSMVFKLLGGEAVKEAVTVKHKPKCVTCGKQNKATSKFCQECGTALEIFA